MMKSDTKKLLFAVTIIIIVIISGFLIKKYLYISSNQLLSQITKIEDSINTNQWTRASETSQVLNTNWHRTENIWTIFTNHHEIDNITITLENSIEYIKMGDKADSLANLASLKHYIKHIPEMERIIIKNIF